MLKKRKHEFDSFFYGLVLAKSKALVRFVNDHKAGGDYARKKIIIAKYELSKLNPVLRGFFIRALHNPSGFTIERISYLTSDRAVGIACEITDRISPHGNIQYQIQSRRIMMEHGKYQLTSEPHDIMIYNSVFNALMVKKKNLSEIDFNIKKREQIEHYMKNYGNEYP